MKNFNKLYYLCGARLPDSVPLRLIRRRNETNKIMDPIHTYINRYITSVGLCYRDFLFFASANEEKLACTLVSRVSFGLDFYPLIFIAVTCSL